LPGRVLPQTTSVAVAQYFCESCRHQQQAKQMRSCLLLVGSVLPSRDPLRLIKPCQRRLRQSKTKTDTLLWQGVHTKTGRHMKNSSTPIENHKWHANFKLRFSATTISLPSPSFNSRRCASFNVFAVRVVAGSVCVVVVVAVVSAVMDCSNFTNASATATRCAPSTAGRPPRANPSCHIFCFFDGLSASDPGAVACIVYRIPGSICFHRPSAQASGIFSFGACPFRSLQGRNVHRPQM